MALVPQTEGGGGMVPGGAPGGPGRNPHYLAPGGKAARLSKLKNKTPAEIQITAEQILREAKDRQVPETFSAPKTKITDPAELRRFQLGKRKQFEDSLRRNRHLVSCWFKYTAFEESQQEYERARSIFERAIHVDYRNPSLWQRYAEMEMRGQFLNHARNVWERATGLLPRVDALWLKWVHMEETAGNIPGARQVCERWMKWKPSENAWRCYAKMELRYGEIQKAREVIQQFVVCHNSIEAWLYYAKFEEKQQETTRARRVYEEAVQALGQFTVDEKLFVAFAKFEERHKEFERARAIYKFALDNLPKARAEELYSMFSAFEKQHGDTKAIEDVVISKNRFHYEEELRANPYNYDLWFDYVRLEENYGDTNACRDVYERAIANVPLVLEKQYWARYIYLWIMYALYEELEEDDVERTRQVYDACLKVIPHQHFSFAKVWLLYAYFEIRQNDLPKARQILGSALGKSPTKNKLFRSYIELESQLGQYDRVRKLFENWLLFNGTNTQIWLRYCELERGLDEVDRARCLYQLCIDQPLLDMPEVAWKAFIEFEIEQKEFARARKLYEKLYDKTKHYNVCIAFAMFEAKLAGQVDAARRVFQNGYMDLIATSTHAADSSSDENPQSSGAPSGMSDEVLRLLNAWKRFEQDFGTEDTQSLVEDKLNPSRKQTGSRLLAKARQYIEKKRKRAEDGAEEA